MAYLRSLAPSWIIAANLDKKSKFEGGYESLAHGWVGLVFFVSLAGIVTSQSSFFIQPVVLLILGTLVSLVLVPMRFIVGIAFLVITGCILVLSNLWNDASYDGLTYHLAGIYWVRDAANLLMPVSLDPYSSEYVVHYPKLSWFYGAALVESNLGVSFFNSLNLFVMLAVYCFGVSVFISRIRKWQSHLLAAVFALHPIAVSQLFSHYVDGLMASFLSLATLLLLKRTSITWSARDRHLLLLALIAMPGLKFTGLVFTALLAGVYAFVVFVHKPKWPEVRKDLLAVAAKAPLATLILTNPYLTNLALGEHLLHPVFGANREANMILRQTPESFSILGPIEKLFLSLFARSENLGPWSDASLPTLKPPLTFSFLELHEFAAVDVRIAGWGPLFSGVLILSVLLMALLVIRRSDNEDRLPAISMLIAYASISIIFPEGWWARYAVYLPLIPALTLFLVFSTSCAVKSGNSLIGVSRKRIATATAVLCLANSVLIAPFSIANVVSANTAVNQALEKFVGGKAASDQIQWEKQKLHLEPFLARNKLSWREVPVRSGNPANCLEIQGERFCIVKNPDK